MSQVVIVDYGMGNLGSVSRAFEECGAKVRISDDPQEFSTATHIVLPGVGAYPEGMANLKTNGWPEAFAMVAIKEKIPLLGICLGMQLLSTIGQEGEFTRGLDLIPGEVKKLVPLGQGERIPHVGWNEVWHLQENPLFQGIPNGADFYFVHSFHFDVKDPQHMATWTPYCGKFASSVRLGNVFGVQFHPEKSSTAGFTLIRNFLDFKG